MAPTAKSTASEGRSPNLQLQQLKIRCDGGNACSTTRGIDRRWAIGSIQCAIRIMERIAHGQPTVLNFPLEHARFTLGTQNPHAWHPNPHQGVPVPMPNNADSGHRRLTGLDLRNPLESGSEAANDYPPTSWAGSLLWLLRRAARNPLAASAALRNQTVSALDAAGRGSRCCARLAP